MSCFIQGKELKRGLSELSVRVMEESIASRNRSPVLMSIISHEIKVLPNPVLSRIEEIKPLHLINSFLSI